MVLRAVPWLVAVALAAPSGASAQEDGGRQHRPIVSRDYAIDLHQGAALGSVRAVGMGGTGVATGVGSAGALFNPAAVAVRPETSRGEWDWDWHFDYLSSAPGTDHDNDGLPQERRFGPLDGPLVTAGLVGQYRGWGLGVSFLFSKHPIERSDALTVIPSVLVGRLDLARSFLGDQLTVGAGFRSGTFQIAQSVDDGGGPESTDLFSMGGAALEVGALWRPRAGDVRIGAAASLPVTGDEVEVDECDPLDCGGDPAAMDGDPDDGFILPERAVLPWQVSIGAAWRRAATAWNRPVAGDWRDERHVLFAADLVVTGHVPGAFGVGAFSAGRLQPSGRDVGISPRLGVEHEWVPGRFRVRGGTYWEPSRFRDPEGDPIVGRLHLTAGLDLRVWQFGLWGDRHRVRLSLTSDLARNYGNGGISIGFWH